MFEWFVLAAIVAVLIATFVNSRRGDAEMIERNIARRAHRNSFQVKLFVAGTLLLGAVAAIIFR